MDLGVVKMNNKTIGIVLVIIALIIIFVTPYFMYPNSDETSRYYLRAIYNIMRNMTVSLIIGLIGIRFYFKD